MPKVKKQPEVPAPLPIGHVIEPNAVYSRLDVMLIFRLKECTIRKETQECRLRVAKIGGKYQFRGSWLLEWIDAGEVKAGKE